MNNAFTLKDSVYDFRDMSKHTGISVNECIESFKRHYDRSVIYVQPTESYDDIEFVMLSSNKEAERINKMCEDFEKMFMDEPFEFNKGLVINHTSLNRLISRESNPKEALDFFCMAINAGMFNFHITKEGRIFFTPKKIG